MKWFKHYVSATEDSETLKKVLRAYGLEGEARYWRLVGLLCKQFKGDNTVFIYSLETIRESLRHRSLSDSRTFLDHLATICSFRVKYIGNDCRMTYAKIAEIKDNHTSNLQVTSKSLASGLSLDKEIRKKNKKKEREYKDLSPSGLIDYWSSHLVPKGYPEPLRSAGDSFKTKFDTICGRLEKEGMTWMTYLSKIDDSSFLMEKKQGGKPTVMWIINEENFDKVISKNFDNTSSLQDSASIEKSMDF